MRLMPAKKKIAPRAKNIRISFMLRDPDPPFMKLTAPRISPAMPRKVKIIPMTLFSMMPLF